MELLIYDQAEQLRHQLERQDKQKAKTISIVSGKGGVGKSNVAINFALELIKQNKKVLIIDLDMGMGNIDILLGVQAKKTILDLLTERLPIFDIVETHSTGLAYISGGSSLNYIFNIEQSQLDYFIQEFTKMQFAFDFILFDMGAGVTEASLFFTMAADESILITTSEPTSITDGYAMLKQIISHDANFKVSLVLNRCMAMKKCQGTITRFQEIVARFLHFDLPVLGILPDDKNVSQAVMKQMPYTLYNPKASVSIATAKLVEHYLIAESKAAINNDSSFLKRFKSFFKWR